MRRELFALLASLATVTAAIAPPAAALVEKPRYTRGDFWRYATNLTEDFGLRLDGNTTVTAGAVRTVAGLNATYEALEMALEGDGSFYGAFPGFGTVTGTWTVTGIDDWETGAWNSVHSFVRLTAQGTLQGGPTPVAFTLEVRNETNRRIATDTFGWPIADGASGETRAEANTSLNVTLQFQGFPPAWNQTWFAGTFGTTHAEQGAETVTVPAGTFVAHRIVEVGPEGGRRERWYSPRVGGDVREWDFNVTGDRVASSELTGFSYVAGAPTPPFPWTYVVLAGLTGAVAVLAVLALRKRRKKTAEVWMPPEAPGNSP
ncbi:MAG TPA: hypothetical protein VGR51_08880 [Thermoplasmata archaeon]|jgi:hypothetical protein|nr:hypothetical protein [Thermoplasmata archaeon]